MATKKIFHAKTQQVEDAELTVDQNNEIVATFADGAFVKFPAGIDADTLDKLIAAQEEANTGQEVITAEQEAATAAERAASFAAIGEVDPATVDDTETADEAPAEDAGTKVEVKTTKADTTAVSEQSNAPATTDTPATPTA